MKEKIEQYEHREPSVVAVGEQRVRAFVGDAGPSLESVLWIGEVATRIVTLAGARRVEALCFDTDRVAVGDAVRCSGETAGWPAPQHGRTALRDLAFEPGRTAPPERPRGTTAPAAVGVEVLDELLPIARHGVTLLLDTGAPDAVFDALFDTIIDDDTTVCASARPVAVATHQVLGSSALALEVAARWANELGGTLVIEAPPFGLDEVLDRAAGITAIVRILVHDGLAILAETLDLGHSDTQILLREDGTIDLTRSESRLVGSSPRARRLERLAVLREKMEIFGEHEADDEDLALLREADALEAGLLFGEAPVTG